MHLHGAAAQYASGFQSVWCRGWRSRGRSTGPAIYYPAGDLHGKSAVRAARVRSAVPSRSCSSPKQKSVNLNHLTLPEIKDFNALSDALCCRLNGFRSKVLRHTVELEGSQPIRGWMVEHLLSFQWKEFARPAGGGPYVGGAPSGRRILGCVIAGSSITRQAILLGKICREGEGRRRGARSRPFFRMECRDEQERALITSAHPQAASSRSRPKVLPRRMTPRQVPKPCSGCLRHARGMLPA